MTLLACIGHWYTDLLYLAPVGLMVGLLGVDKAKQRIKVPRERRARWRNAAP